MKVDDESRKPTKFVCLPLFHCLSLNSLHTALIPHPPAGAIDDDGAELMSVVGSDGNSYTVEDIADRSRFPSSSASFIYVYIYIYIYINIL